MQKYTIIIKNIQVNVIKRANQKNIYVRISDNGKIILSSPLFVNDSYIRDFVARKYDSIMAMRNSKKVEECGYERCDVHYLFGKKYELDIRENKYQSVVLLDNKIIINVSDSYNVEKKQKLLEKFYKEQLEEKIQELAPKYEKMMNLHANEYRIKKMKTRWGTCNINQKRIWINLELAKKKQCFLEYIIVHELAHLIEKYHNKRFYDIVEKYCPYYKSIQKMLNSR